MTIPTSAHSLVRSLTASRCSRQRSGGFSLSKRDSWEPGVGDDAISSWLLDAVQLSFVGDPVDTQYLDTVTSTPSTNITAYFYSAIEDSMQAWQAIQRLNTDLSMTALFQQILRDQGTAYALQSLLAVFTSKSYYDQLQQFNNANNITTTSFIVVSKPTTVSGLTAVTIVASVHLLLVAYIIYQFSFSSSVSTIGNAWQAVAQVDQGDAKELVDSARLATDNKVEDIMKTQRWKRRFVGLRASADNTDVELTHKDSLSGLAKLIKNTR